MKKILCVILFAVLSLSVMAQSNITEIVWNDCNGITYRGLMVLYPNNRGVFKVNYYTYITGWVWVQQDAYLTNTYDVYGCTSYINCYNPRTVPYTPYAADNFICYPNGAMYTQDAAGKWSTLITAYLIPPNNWRTKLSEYGL